MPTITITDGVPSQPITVVQFDASTVTLVLNDAVDPDNNEFRAFINHIDGYALSQPYVVLTRVSGNTFTLALSAFNTAVAGTAYLQVMEVDGTGEIIRSHPYGARTLPFIIRPAEWPTRLNPFLNYTHGPRDAFFHGDYGVRPVNSAANNRSQLQDALDNAALDNGNRVVEIVRGGYHDIDAKVTVPAGVSLIMAEDATLRAANFAGEAVLCESHGNLNGMSRVKVNLRRQTLQWYDPTSPGDTDSIGLLAKNCFHTIFEVNADRFVTGVELRGDGEGCASNQVRVQMLRNNKVGVRGLAVNDGYCNENRVFGNCIKKDTNYGSGGIHGVIAGTKAIDLSMTGDYDSIYGIGGWKVEYMNLEGDSDEYTIDIGGNRCFIFENRHEDNLVPIYYRAGSSNNKHGGASLDMDIVAALIVDSGTNNLSLTSQVRRWVAQVYKQGTDLDPVVSNVRLAEFGAPTVGYVPSTGIQTLTWPAGTFTANNAHVNVNFRNWIPATPAPIFTAYVVSDNTVWLRVTDDDGSTSKNTWTAIVELEVFR